MTDEQDKILRYALNIARIKLFGAAMKEGRLIRILDTEKETYLEQFRNGLELAAERELLERANFERPTNGEQPT